MANLMKITLYITLLFALASSVYYMDVQCQDNALEPNNKDKQNCNNTNSENNSHEDIGNVINDIKKELSKQKESSDQLNENTNNTQKSQPQTSRNTILRENRYRFSKNPQDHTGESLAIVNCPKNDNEKKTAFVGKGSRWNKIRNYFNSRCDYKITNNIEDNNIDFMYAVSAKQAEEYFQPGKQIVNRIKQFRNLLSKKDLFSRNLKEFDKLKKYKYDSTEFRFKTFEFNLDTSVYNQEEQYFMDHVNDGFWVTKDPDGQNGYGIVVYKSPDPIKEMVKKYKSQSKNTTENSEEKQTLFVEEYMHNPFLWDQKKIDHRSYILVASTDPLVILYQDGFIKRCIEKYDNDFTEFDINAIFKHITNRKQYKDIHPDFNKVENDLILTIPELEHYMKTQYNFTDEQFQKLNHDKQKMLAYCVMAVIDKVDKKQGAYQLLGFDYIFDENFNVKIIEINTMPEINGSLSGQKYVYPQLVQSILDLMIDTLQDPTQTLQKWQNTQNLELGKWEIIINEAQNYNILDQYEIKN